MVAEPNNKKWRLNNYYRIVSRDGDSVPFKLNPVQEKMYDGMHTRNLFLKARQLGSSTFAVLYLLDEAIFTPNLACGIVSYSLEHAQHIFKRIIGHALDTLKPPVDQVGRVIQRSAREVVFANGSFIRVDTTLRGGAYQLVLVSEFGKTCARNPLKAEEVITGTLNTLSQSSKCIIESTGEGNEGFFAEMVHTALESENEELSPLQYKLHFFPWYTEESYQTKQKMTYDITLEDYFRNIESEIGIKLSQYQKNWYAFQQCILGEKIKQEFPSTVKEAFLSSSDAYYFQTLIEEAYRSNRCLSNPIYDALAPVYAAMDIGINDLTVIIFFQVIHGEIRIIDFYADKDKGVDFYARFLLQDKRYIYHTIFLPHDAGRRDGIIVENTYERDFKKYFSHTETKFVILKRTEKSLQIGNAKIKFERCVFDLKKTKALLDQLSKYRKKWSEATGRWLDEPVHDIACFIGETLVETEFGKIRIDQIKVGDKVLTPNGLKTVKNIFKYKTDHLVKIETENSTITCTPHHKIFTNKGLIIADTLCYNSCILTKNNSDIWLKIGFLGKERKLGFKDYFLSMNQKQLSSLMDINIQKMNLDIGLEEEKIKDSVRCIKVFGHFIMGRFQKAIAYIILMGISLITRLKILKSCLFLNIYLCICQQKNVFFYHDKLSKKQMKLLKYGTEVKKGENGTLNTVKKRGKIKKYLKKLVKFVKKNISLNGNIQECVLMHVEQNLEEDQGKMTKQENVKTVKKNTFVINILNKSFALLNALIYLIWKIKKTTYLKPVLYVKKNLNKEGTQKFEHVRENVELFLDTEIDVYDLEVEDDHCYFANDLLVSNSNYGDSFQYVCSAVTHIETVGSMKGAIEKHKEAVEMRRYRI